MEALKTTDVWVPSPPLSDFIALFWIQDSCVQPHAFERVLPTGTMQVLFSIDPGGRTANRVVGARSESLVLPASRPFRAIGVHFKPGGGFPFFSVPGGLLHNSSVPLEEIWGGDAGNISEQLWSAETSEARFRVLDRAFLERIKGPLACHPAVRYALSMFVRSNGGPAVGKVVHNIGISSRRFADIFKDEVGLSPKLFCRIRRLSAVLRQLEHATDVNWTDVALSCGYFDQAHFNHDFHAFAGMNPSAYLRNRITRTHVVVR